ncbi:MAG: hypothetical protein WDM89_10325 [Rhizomicrobium sp.]
MAATCAIWKAAANSIARWSSCRTMRKSASARRTTKGLTRPELAVLLAYSKLDLKDELIASALPDDPHFEFELASYFPDMMVQKSAARWKTIACAAKSSPTCSPTES